MHYSALKWTEAFVGDAALVDFISLGFLALQELQYAVYVFLVVHVMSVKYYQFPCLWILPCQMIAITNMFKLG